MPCNKTNRELVPEVFRFFERHLGFTNDDFDVLRKFEVFKSQTVESGPVTVEFQNSEIVDYIIKQKAKATAEGRLKRAIRTLQPTATELALLNEAQKAEAKVALEEQKARVKQNPRIRNKYPKCCKSLTDKLYKKAAEIRVLNVYQVGPPRFTYDEHILTIYLRNTTTGVGWLPVDQMAQMKGPVGIVQEAAQEVEEVFQDAE